MERENSSSFTSQTRVSLDPRLSTHVIKSHHAECIREISPLLATLQFHLQKALELQNIIQEKLDSFANMQSPLLPKRLRASCDTSSPRVVYKSPTISETEVAASTLAPIVTKPSRFAKWLGKG